VKLLYESPVRDEAGLILLRSRLRAVAHRKTFVDVEIEKMELVCNEIVTNQIKHARGSGMVQLWEVDGSQQCLDIFGLDYGPGIKDVEHSKKDGSTTTGTLGKGLGAIERLSKESAIYSLQADNRQVDRWHGTAVWSRFIPGNKKTRQPIEYGTFLRAFQDNFYNGDYVSIKNGADRVKWVHLDGLGHGKLAAEAVLPARSILEDEVKLDERIVKLSEKLQFGRGAVGILGEIDASDENLLITGVGDMNAYVISDGERRAMSIASGILGQQHRSIVVNDIPFSQRAVVITASDGVKSWKIDTLPQLWRLHPQMIAFVMGNVLGRSNDDTSLVVVRRTPEHKKK
jgi:anti-sigma regulatory factor (Ser/Thr protein kinase)